MEVVSKNELSKKKVKNVSLETFVFLAILIGGFGYVGSVMGAGYYV